MRILLALFLTTALFFVPSKTALAESTARPATQLGEHRFVPTLAGFEPFITTHFRTAPGMGLAIDLEAPFRNLRGETIAVLEGDVAFLVLEMEYQKALSDWLAARIGATGVGRVGTNEQSVIFQGVSAVTGFGIGALFNVWKHERAMLSGAFDVQNSMLYAVTPLSFVQSVIDRGELGDPGENSLVTEEDSYRMTLGLRFAYAVNRWWGFSLLAETGSAQPFAKNEDPEFLFTGGGAVSVDLGAGTNVPVGLTLSYIDDSFPENGDDVAKSIRSIAFGVSYTGRDDFDIGAEVTYSKFPLTASDTTVDAMLLRLKLHYFF